MSCTRKTSLRIGFFSIEFAWHKTSRGLCLKFDRKPCTYCLAGQNGRFQILLSQPPPLFFVQSNDPSVLCDHCMGAFRTHSCTRFVTGELPQFKRVDVLVSSAAYARNKTDGFLLFFNQIEINKRREPAKKWSI